VASTATEKKPADETTRPKGWSFLKQGSGEEGNIGVSDEIGASLDEEQRFSIK